MCALHVLYLHICFIQKHYYYAVWSHSVPYDTGCMCSTALCFASVSAAVQPAFWPELIIIVFSLLFFALFPETLQFITRRKASTTPHRRGSISDPADKPSVHPSRSGIWSIQPRWTVNVAAVVSHIDWNNGSAFGSQWTHCTSSMTTEVPASTPLCFNSFN